MDINKMLSELRSEQAHIGEAIAVLGRLAAGRGRRRGRPPAWMAQVIGKKRGRPPGSKNKVTKMNKPRSKPKLKTDKHVAGTLAESATA